MRWVPLAACLLTASSLCLPLADAQAAGQFKPSLDLRVESQPAEALGTNATDSAIVIRWTYTFKETTTAVLAQSSTGTTIRFTPAPVCSAAGMIVTGPASVRVVFAGPGPGAMEPSYQGLVTFRVTATPEAQPGAVVECRFSASAEAVNSQIVATEAAPVAALVSVAGESVAPCSGADCPPDTKDSPGLPLAFAVALLAVAALAARRKVA